MPVALSEPEASNQATDGYPSHEPEYDPDAAVAQPEAVEPAAEDRTDRSGETADANAEAVDRPQHARVRRAVVDQDGLARQRERPANDLDEQQAPERDPDPRPRLPARRRRGRRHEREERDDRVRDGEADDEEPVRPQRAQPRGEPGVQEQLQDDADRPEQRHRAAYLLGRQPEPAGEAEGELWDEARRLRLLGVVDRRR